MIPSLLDKRYKKTQRFLDSGKGEPVYRKRAFTFIDKILGPQYKWINKSPEEYFTDDEYEEARKAINILRFNSTDNLRSVKARYRKLSKGDYQKGEPGFHPDSGGHSSAFAILEHAYRIFERAHDI